MGKWLKVLDVKAGTSVEALKQLSEVVLEGKIIEAECVLEEEFNLQIETSMVPPWPNAKDVPWQHRGTFNAFPAEEQKFYEAARRCTLMILDRIAQNPRGYISQSVKGANAEMGDRVPDGCYTIMRRWASPLEVNR
jgi:hypothetical protein